MQILGLDVFEGGEAKILDVRRETVTASVKRSRISPSFLYFWQQFESMKRCRLSLLPLLLVFCLLQQGISLLDP